ncbi:hypothetical protein [Chondromyces apiculatus]|uniref:Uncharacterized protein n=1 Tax=Chondromyces apiculatus DSM 436 TaxID=1192034 RepID=A0A017T5M4_9BACT|nr:hypothetical protein [Chondromyces apiculatus]EYF03881.1 Hypothetical protein CAP_5145 [Chondromyces apiculatus DSM 436]
MTRIALLPLLLAAACAGTPPPDAPPSGLSDPPIRPLMVAAPQPDPVAVVEAAPPTAPSGLVAIARIDNPLRTWGDVTMMFASTPLGGLLMTAGQLGPELFIESSLGPALANIVDLEKPLDVALLDTTASTFVVSLSVAERDVPRLQERFTLREQDGLFRVEGFRMAGQRGETPPLPCALDMGDRQGSARLVCASKKEALSAAPYLTQVVAREPLDVDARLEFPTTLFSTVLAEQRSKPRPDDENSAARVGAQVFGDFMSDVAGMTVDLSRAGQNIDVGLGVRFSSRRSPLALALVPAARPDQPAPEMFFRLPRDAGLAFHSQGASREELTPLRKLLHETLVASVVTDGYDQGKSSELLERMGALFLGGGPFVLAAGMDRAAADKALAAYQSKKNAPKAREAARRSLAGWGVVGIDTPPGPWIAEVKQMLALNEEIDRTHKKPATPSPSKADRERKETSKLVLGRAPATLPAGTLHIEERTKPLTKDAPPAHTTHFYAVPEGERLWIGVGEDSAAVLDHLRIALDPSRSAQTLASEPAMAALRQPGATTGGLLSMAGITGLFASGDTPEALDEAAEDLSGLASLPSRGEIQIPWTVVSEVYPSGAARWGLRVRLSSPLIHDIIARVMR